MHTVARAVLRTKTRNVEVLRPHLRLQIMLSAAQLRSRWSNASQLATVFTIAVLQDKCANACTYPSSCRRFVLGGGAHATLKPPPITPTLRRKTRSARKGSPCIFTTNYPRAAYHCPQMEQNTPAGDCINVSVLQDDSADACTECGNCRKQPRETLREISENRQRRKFTRKG